MKPETWSLPTGLPPQSEETSNWAVAETIMLTFDCKFKQIAWNILEDHKTGCALGNMVVPRNKMEVSYRK